MLQDIAVAKYFLSKDTQHKLFNKNLIHKNGRDFYEGNARLNKYLHLAQNIFLAKYGVRLFSGDLYAYDNGAVAPIVQENYAVLLSKSDIPSIPTKTKDYLDRIYKIFENASLEELIELSHEDTAWRDKHNFYSKADQRMDTDKHIDEYREQYADLIKLMGRIEV